MDLRSYGMLAAVAVPFVLFGLATIAWQRYRKRATLSHVAHRLEDAVIDANRGTVDGFINRRRVRGALTSRGYGSAAEEWTEVTLDLPEPCIPLELRRQTLAETIDVRRKLAVDVTTGDAAFDRAFIVEGAPAEAVRKVLSDAMLRASLVALGVEVTRPAGALMVSRKGWAWSGRLFEMVDLGARLAASLVAVGTDVLPPAAEENYRTQPLRTDSAELDALAEAQANRSRKMGTKTIVVVTIAVLFVTLSVLSIVWPR